MKITKENTIGVIGCGAMGSGIAQVAAIAGHEVIIFDTNLEALERSRNNLESILLRLETKGKISNASSVLGRISFIKDLTGISNASLIIEAIIENIDIKKNVFQELESIVSENCILATNTSSLSITSIASACTKPSRVVGLHFFNPAPVMQLVEIIPSIQTNIQLIPDLKNLMQDWGKTPVIAKDTPGFIVNRVARPFYGEALRILDEGIADCITIDHAITKCLGFKMGPFRLMDYIGHDVNYIVTETVFQSFFFDPRYKPSFSQKRLLEAGWLGIKSNKGFYDYTIEESLWKKPDESEVLCKEISERILCMLINEAAEALYWNIASIDDIELSMTKGVNYPKGLLAWCDQLGADYVLAQLDHLHNIYKEDRYRPSLLIRKHGTERKRFFE